MGYSVTKYEPYTVDVKTGNKVMQKSADFSTWKEVVKAVFEGDWFYGTGFVVRKDDRIIGDQNTFFHCENSDTPTKITLREFEDTWAWQNSQSKVV